MACPAACAACLEHAVNPGRAPAAAQRGIAMVVALWLVVLLTIIGSSHARNVRVETRLAHNHLDTARARALVEAGVNRAIMELFVSNASERWRFDGSVYEFEFDGSRVQAAIRNATGLIDLNTAQAPLLLTVLDGLGVDEPTALGLADAILDWRDPDNLLHLHGAEDRDYRHAGLEWEARDGPFTSIDELRYVMGMTKEIFLRLAPYLTVHSGHTDIELKYAPPWLVSLLGTGEGDPRASDVNQGISATGVYHIHAWATSAGGSHASMEVVLRTQPGQDPPYRVLSWLDPARAGTWRPE